MGVRFQDVLGFRISRWSGLMRSSWPVKRSGARCTRISVRLRRFPGAGHGWRGRGSHVGIVRPLAHDPALPSSPSFTLVTGRIPVVVAPCGLFSLGCHNHGQIEGCCQAEEARGALPGRLRPDHAVAWMMRRAPRVKGVAVGGGWAGSRRPGLHHVTAKYQGRQNGLNGGFSWR
jgi:hypothetical protein